MAPSRHSATNGKGFHPYPSNRPAFNAPPPPPSNQKSTPYTKMPYDCPTPHPALRKLAGHLFIILPEHYPNVQCLITASEIQECINCDKMLRRGKLPPRFPLVYDLFAAAFNNQAPSTMTTRFAVYDSTGPRILFAKTSTPPQRSHFGIQDSHVGKGLDPNSIANNRGKERVLNHLLLTRYQDEMLMMAAPSSRNQYGYFDDDAEGEEDPTFRKGFAQVTFDEDVNDPSSTASGSSTSGTSPPSKTPLDTPKSSASANKGKATAEDDDAEGETDTPMDDARN
ncbi:hypothetical protein CVT24_011796 [Panaeolus cyanescens]|uniref:Uncharacterized protein n=1 Tax=Panaeolus cyanescens TaxID=181874 RepID=A0A409X5P3_9AGAR|nr:hypothetical protein CVT24_011796 [Panaeolus cyanescens]